MAARKTSADVGAHAKGGVHIHVHHHHHLSEAAERKGGRDAAHDEKRKKDGAFDGDRKRAPRRK